MSVQTDTDVIVTVFVLVVLKWDEKVLGESKLKMGVNADLSFCLPMILTCDDLLQCMDT